VKYYDKGAWAAHQGSPLPPGQHKLRYEVVCTRARPINALLNQAQVTLADLATPGFYLAAAAELRKHWQLTVRRTPLNFTGLKWKDSALLQSGGSLEFWRGLKQAKIPLVTIKRQKARYKQLAAAAQKRAGVDVYNQRFPLVLADMLATVPAAGNDTLLHSCNQVEFPPIKEREEAPAPFPTAEGLLVEQAVSSGPREQEQERRREQQLDREREQWQERELDRKREQWQESEREREQQEREQEQEDLRFRCCQTCGASIDSSRQPSAKYCNKKCRNAASNPGHNARRTLLKIESQPLLFPIREFVRVPEHYRAFVLAAAA
jgi:hypothetical protein